jgi:Tol biopolymer transport system component/DNA-binding winged helix-turn-helix (wHTH) protein
MATSNSFAACARFDDFHVDLKGGILQRSGVRLPVQSQPLQVLRLLLQAQGKVVTRDELRKVLWPEDTFVDFELGVNTAVKKLRQALADPAERPKFIETLPRVGYRFLVPVEWVTEDGEKGLAERPGSSASASGIGVADVSERSKTATIGLSSPGSGGARRGKFTGKLRLLAVATTILVVGSGTGIWKYVHNRRQTALPPIEVVPLIALHGMQGAPAFSPDGNQVAFAEYEGGKASGIDTTLIGGEKPVQVTDNPGDYSPTWSPDSRQIAFVRSFEKDMAIYVVPALGGTLHKLYMGPSNGSVRLNWSPDGSVLAFSESSANDVRSWIALLSFTDLTTRPLTSPPQQELDEEPAFSPDGSKVAFVRGSVGGAGRDLFVLPVTGGEPKRLTFDNSSWSPVWTQDGSAIVFPSARGGVPRLWRISASGGSPQPVAGVGETAFGPSISRKGNQLVYQHFVDSSNIWRINLKNERHSAGSPVSVIPSRGANWRPSFSPDGKKIAFDSDRLGYSDIWQCESDGSNCVQLTSLHATSGTARWSPDGHYIAFESQSLNYVEIYVLEVPGGRPRLVPTFPGGDNGAPNWSRDGQWIYFYSKHETGPLQLWKVPFQGGSPVQVTKNGGVYAIESDDGRFLYYSKFEQPGIWKMPLNGGEETRVLDQPAGEAWFDWALATTGIYFINASAEPNGRIEFFDIASRKTTPIFSLQKPFYKPKGLALSPDGTSLLYTQNESPDSYIMLVKNFR